VSSVLSLNLNDVLTDKQIFILFVVNGRSFEDEKKAKMGIVECVKHSLIEPFSVLYEREGIPVLVLVFSIYL